MEFPADYSSYRQVLLRADVFEQWAIIGRDEGLTTDTAIATFLIELYDEKQKGVQLVGSCISCNSVLTSVCLNCQLPSILSHHDAQGQTTTTTTNTIPSGAMKFSADQNALCYGDATTTISQESGVTLMPGVSEGLSSDEGDNCSVQFLTDSADISEVRNTTSDSSLISNEQKRKKPGHKTTGKTCLLSKQEAVMHIQNESVRQGRQLRQKQDSVSQTVEYKSDDRRKIDCNTNRKGSNSNTMLHAIGIQRAPYQKVKLTPDQIIQGEDGRNRYMCKVCKAVFKHRGKLHRHFRTHTGEKPFQCTVCLMTFARDTDLARHCHAHSEERPWVCDVCGVRYKYSNNLADHVKTHKQKEHACPHCPAAFHNSRDLVIHLRSHTGELPYACELCGHMFSRLSSLVKHRDAHEGHHPFPCRMCPKTFSQTNAIKRHMLTVHKVSESEIFACSQCTETFARTRDLKQHIKVAHHCPENVKQPRVSTVNHDSTTAEQLETENAVTQISTLNDPGTVDALTGNRTNGISAVRTDDLNMKISLAQKDNPNLNVGQNYNNLLFSVSESAVGGVVKSENDWCSDRDSHEIQPSFCGDVQDAQCLSENDQTFEENRGGSGLSDSEFSDSVVSDDTCDYNYRPKGKKRRKAPVKNSSENKKTGVQGVVCDTCGLTLSSQNCLARHRRQVHGPSTAPFACPHCEKRFHRSYTLKEHVGMVHEGVKQHMCSQCGFVFGNRYHLKRHTGAFKPGGSFQCPDCEANFVCQKHFGKHIKTHPPRLRGPRGSYGRQTKNTLEAGQNSPTQAEGSACIGEQKIRENDNG